MTNNLTFIDLFAGCGGLSLGLIESGWRCNFAIEVNPDAFKTYRHNLIDNFNHKNSHHWPAWLPVKPHNIRTFLHQYRKELKKLRGKVTLVAGGPPCQGFSILGRRNADDSRNTLINDYVSFVNAVLPKYVLLENVVGIKTAHGKDSDGTIFTSRGMSGETRLTKKLQKNYEVFPKILRASDYGVAQHRPRFIAIGVRRDLIQNHESFNVFSELDQIRKCFLIKKGLPQSPISVQDAISDLETNGKELVPYPSSKRHKQIRYIGPRTPYQKLLHGNLNGTAPNSLRLVKHGSGTLENFRMVQSTCPQGKSLSGPRLAETGVRKGYLTWMSPNVPSHTISTIPDDLLHYSEPRVLTVRENARLQSFPDWFEFLGKYTTGGQFRKKECPRYTQVGNAVAPIFAEFLGDLILTKDEEINESQGSLN